MIAWDVAAGLLAELLAAQSSLAERAQRAFANAPRFQNRAFDLDPLPLAIDAGALAEHVARAERYAALLERLVALYAVDDELRDYFALSAQEDALVRCASGLPRAVQVCRLDGYLEEYVQTVRFLEHNADAPAGTLFTGRVGAFVAEVIAPELAGAPAARAALPLEAPRAMLDTLLDAYGAWGGDAAAPVLAILQRSDNVNVESVEMAQEYSRHGIRTLVADPRDLRFTGRAVYAGATRIDLVWNKINTVGWNGLARETPGLLAQWRTAIEGRAVCHLNSFGARYVAESKRALAALQEPRFAHHFSAEERQLVAEVLPWARRLEPGLVVEADGERVDARELLSERQTDYVLKDAYDIRGDGVTIGRSVGRRQWLAALDHAIAQRHTVQRFVRPTSYPVVTLDGPAPRVTPMIVSLDTYLFGGRFVGLGSKASLADKVNVFQGGRKIAAFAFEPARVLAAT